LFEATDTPPDPDCRVLADVVFVEPRIRVLAAAPVATLTAVAAASAETLIALVPEATVNVPPPKEAAPPVAVTVVPTVREVVVCTDPGAINAEGTESVKEFRPPVVVIWLAVPANVKPPVALGTTGFVPASGTIESNAMPPPVRATVTVDPVAEVVTPLPPTIAIAPPVGVALPVSPVNSSRSPDPALRRTQLAVTVPEEEEKELNM
jgi:hypothetical protein